MKAKDSQFKYYVLRLFGIILLLIYIIQLLYVGYHLSLLKQGSAAFSLFKDPYIMNVYSGRVMISLLSLYPLRIGSVMGLLIENISWLEILFLTMIVAFIYVKEKNIYCIIIINGIQYIILIIYALISFQSMTLFAALSNVRMMGIVIIIAQVISILVVTKMIRNLYIYHKKNKF